jgi:hypothetical protein
MIEVNGLSKRFGGRVVVDDVSFRCETGTVTGRRSGLVRADNHWRRSEFVRHGA